MDDPVQTEPHAVDRMPARMIKNPKSKMPLAATDIILNCSSVSPHHSRLPRFRNPFKIRRFFLISSV